MSAITYIQKKDGPFAITVRLDGKKVGTIKQTEHGQYYYAPVGARKITGDKFPNVAAVKRSIEGR